MKLYRDVSDIPELQERQGDGSLTSLPLNHASDEPDAEFLVMKDDPFLPAGVCSIYDAYLKLCCGVQETQRDIYFPFLPVPRDWEIRGYSLTKVKIVSEGRIRGLIDIREPYEKGFVGAVSWMDADGEMPVKDFYHRGGYVYRREFSEREDEKLIVYCKPDGEEWLTVNRSNGVVMFTDDRKHRTLFGSVQELEEELLRRISAHVTVDDRRN